MGVLGYRMLTGELPGGVFSGPKADVPEIPDALNDMIMCAMSRKIKKRQLSALDFLRQISPIRAQIRGT